MILGIGSDIVDIKRVEATLRRFGDRFAHRCFDPIEIEKAVRRQGGGGHVATYARRFAAKEAVAKALGTGFSAGVFMRDIVVVNDAAGKPTLVLKNGALRRLEEMAPQGKKVRLHVSLTDDAPMAFAHVVIEAE